MFTMKSYIVGIMKDSIVKELTNAHEKAVAMQGVDIAVLEDLLNSVNNTAEVIQFLIKGLGGTSAKAEPQPTEPKVAETTPQVTEPQVTEVKPQVAKEEPPKVETQKVESADTPDNSEVSEAQVDTSEADSTEEQSDTAEDDDSWGSVEDDVTQAEGVDGWGDDEDDVDWGASETQEQQEETTATETDESVEEQPTESNEEPETDEVSETDESTDKQQAEEGVTEPETATEEPETDEPSVADDDTDYHIARSHTECIENGVIAKLIVNDLTFECAETNEDGETEYSYYDSAIISLMEEFEDTDSNLFNAAVDDDEISSLGKLLFSNWGDVADLDELEYSDAVPSPVAFRFMFRMAELMNIENFAICQLDTLFETGEDEEDEG